MAIAIGLTTAIMIYEKFMILGMQGCKQLE